ncbi:hypothetical protein AB0O76_27480 [Streptomyces sp. NPDC086554]|uniref:hypothetical protein n=1 Tax=Streptomyces sp. NPDC086554 TaxID=3154864 RepID=UPI0034302F09
MTTTTVARIILAPREQQVLEGLADGSTLAVVALTLKIREVTAAGYLKLAKRKLHGVSENAAALAVGYTVHAIARPELLDPEHLFLPLEQRQLVPFVARGMHSAQMATDLKRPADVVRRDGRNLMTNLGARNPAHVVTRAWQYQILTADQVISWLR